MKARRSTAPHKVSQPHEQDLEITLEMLKMKKPPGMCMKTKARMTKCPVKNMLFTRKSAHCALIDSNLTGILAEIARISRSFGENQTDV
jgi:hypothetical protein